MQVCEWVFSHAKGRDDVEYEIVDIADHDLPMLNETFPPSLGRYEHEHTKRWAEKVASLDGFIFVTPEYNHSTSAALKNALDFVYKEWNNKSAGFVSYGSALGVRAVEHLRAMMAELQIADVRQQVMLSLFTDFEAMSKFAPDERHKKSLATLFDQVEAWARALKGLREG